MTAVVAVILAVAVVLAAPGRPSVDRVLDPRTMPRPVRRPRRARVPAQHAEERFIAFLDVLAPSLRAGRAPEEAIRLACDVVDGSPVVDALGAAVRSGLPIEAALERQAGEYPEVRFLAEAWQLSARIGCPLAEVVESSARTARARLDLRRRVTTASAGADTTIRILTILPLGGPLLAVAVGVDPVEAYVTAPTAWACLAAGITLVLVGRRWVARQVASVARGPVLS